MNASAIARQLIGVVLKDNPDDIKRIRYYMDNVMEKGPEIVKSGKRSLMHQKTFGNKT